MFNTVRRWIFWWKRSKQAKKALQMHIKICKEMGPAEPPTVEEVESFKKHYDMGWGSHMVQRIEPRKTYFEVSIN